MISYFGKERVVDPVWSKVLPLLVLIFLVLLGDGILSDWIPAHMQAVLGGSFVMGLVMAASSVFGILSDFFFPQLLKGVGVKKIFSMALGLGILFSVTLLFSINHPLLLVFVLAMAIWGIYYEFFGFADQIFVADTVSAGMRTKVWAVIGIFRSMAYCFGPIVGGILITKGDTWVVGTALTVTLIAYVILFFLKLGNNKVELPTTDINLSSEVAHWFVLLRHVWPMVVASIVLGMVDATFWTTGTVFNDLLAQRDAIGGFFLSIYMLPSLFVGLLVVRWGIYTGKKKWAEIFMLLSGVFLLLLSINDSTLWILLMVFVSSSMLGVSYPLIDATYSDVISRMGRERKHMVGLSRSTVSVAYIVGPISAGIITSFVGEKMTFVVMGGILVLVSIILLLTTPKKLKLPQVEIQSWN